MLQADLLEHAERAGAGGAPRGSDHLEGKRHVVLDAEPVQQLDVLEDDTDAPP